MVLTKSCHGQTTKSSLGSSSRFNEWEVDSLSPFTTTSSTRGNPSPLPLADLQQKQQQQQQQHHHTVLSGTDDSNKGASIPNLSASLIKSIVGAGILALPAGVATLGDCPGTVLPVALLVITFMGTMNAFTFAILGRVCQKTGAVTYVEAWEKTMGTDTKGVVAITVTMKTALACVAYAMILADSWQSLLHRSGVCDLSRTETLVMITTALLLPLCLQKNVKALAPFSLMGLLGMITTACAILWRYQDGSYSEMGLYRPELILEPQFGTTGPDWHGVILACTLATAFVAHYNAPRFFTELQDRTIPRFNRVIASSYGFATLLFGLVSCAGFLTFGSTCQGYILNNYAPDDPVVLLAQAAVALAITVTFPLPFVGLRDNVADILNATPSQRQEESYRVGLSCMLLLGIIATASSVHDLALLLSIGGGTFSTAVATVFPTLMYRASFPTATWETQLATLVTGIGISIGGTGVYLSLLQAWQ